MALRYAHCSRPPASMRRHGVNRPLGGLLESDNLTPRAGVNESRNGVLEDIHWTVGCSASLAGVDAD